MIWKRRPCVAPAGSGDGLDVLYGRFCLKEGQAPAKLWVQVGEATGNSEAPGAVHWTCWHCLLLNKH